MLDNEDYRFLKVIIKETHGGNRTYLNQLFFFDELSGNTSTIWSNKQTQMPKSNSHTQSLIFSAMEEEEELEEEIKEPVVPINKVKKITKENFRPSGLIRKLESVDHEEEQDEEPKPLINQEKIKRIESVLKDKIKEKVNNQDRKSTEVKRRTIRTLDLDDYLPNPPRIRQRSLENDYEKLETQLRDMENHLKSMDVDFKLENKSYGMSHSKSFSFIHKDSFANPFKGNILKDVKLGNNLVTYSNVNNVKNLIDIPNSPIREYERNIVDRVPNDPTQDRITILENKITSYEKEMSEMKEYIKTLVNNVEILLNGNSKSSPDLNRVNPHHRGNSSGYHMDTNPDINYILNECSRMINERINKEAHQCICGKRNVYQSEEFSSRNFSQTETDEFNMERSNTMTNQYRIP